MKNFSPNMLKTFEQCPKKFHFKYIKNLNMPVNDDIFEFGKNIHALASYYLRKENILKMEDSLNDKERQVWQYLKNIKYFTYQTIETEYNLFVKVNEYFYGGRLDALVKDNNENYYILDYKTGSIPKDAKYDYQTIIYLLAVNENFKAKKLSFVYIDLKNKAELSIDLDNNLINEYQEKLKNITNKIIKSEFSTSKKTTCNCEYDVICYH